MKKIIMLSKVLIALFMVALVSCAPVESTSTSASNTANASTGPSEPEPVLITKSDVRVRDLTGGGGVEITNYTGTETNIRIPDEIDGKAVKEIFNNAFDNKKLTGVVLPESLTRIGLDAFQNNQITTLTIGSQLTVIPNSGFKNNPITSVTLRATTPPVLANSAFTGTIANLYVPASSVDTYKNTPPKPVPAGINNNWVGVFTNISAIPTP